MDVAGLRIAAAWQANKNVLIKGRLGSDGIAVLAAFKSWFTPSLALAATCEYSFAAKAMRYGLTAQVGAGGRRPCRFRLLARRRPSCPPLPPSQASCCLRPTPTHLITPQPKQPPTPPGRELWRPALRALA